MINQLEEAKTAITSTLVAQEPCTLEELVRAVWSGSGIDVRHAMPITIKAIADLMDSGQICEYDDSNYVDDPMDYAWLLSEERFS